VFFIFSLSSPGTRIVTVDDVSLHPVLLFVTRFIKIVVVDVYNARAHGFYSKETSEVLRKDAENNSMQLSAWLKLRDARTHKPMSGN
jgi:hypothetical protein